MKANIKNITCLFLAFIMPLMSVSAEKYYSIYKNNSIQATFSQSSIDSVRPSSSDIKLHHNGSFTTIPRSDVDSLVFLDYNPDLSALGIANCYVAPTAGDYIFSTKLNDNSIKAGDNADYLWTDVERTWANNGGKMEVTAAVEPMDHEYIIKNIAYNADNNTIAFTATGNVGNAVIALYTENAGERTIVWSWHIWSSGYTIDQMSVAGWRSTLLDANNESLTWLDRNIGAINNSMDNAGSYGFVYQWGRKDPFVFSTTVGQKTNPGGTDEATAFSTLTMPTKTNEAFAAGFEVDATLVTVAEVAQSPMKFYLSSGNWATNIPVTAWGDGIAPFATFDGYLKDTDPNENYTDGVRAGSKSIYDPCPSGYRVPTCEEMWLSFAGANYTSGSYSSLFSNVTSTMSTLTNSHLIDCSTDECVKILLPASGHRDNGKVDGLGSAAYYQTSTIDPQKPAQAFRQLVGSNTRVEGSGTFGFARPVRCVKE